GQSSSLRVGEFVVAVGAPADLQDTCTLGIVSAVQRPSSELGLSMRRIGQGNSGGPLVNINGEVVGMSVLKASNLDGVSFAIPIDTVVEMVRQMRRYGKVLRPVLGVKMVSLD
ncbi:trypsin-like cysteine/serine peptidase domain-containing protein, partial [Baffinella frigidus]